MADHVNSKIDHKHHLLLDQSLMRLPYELLRKNFRAAHFSIEKESAAVRHMLRDAATGTLRDSARPEDAARSLDAMLARMRGLRRKLAACAAEEDVLYRQLEARARHLAELGPMRSVDDVTYDAWSRRRLDRLLIDYLLRAGYGRSAEGLARERGMGDLVDLAPFAAMSRVRRALERDHSVVEALAWCAENKKELRRMGSRLEFVLRCQQYIEMVRAGRGGEGEGESEGAGDSLDGTALAAAIQHAQKHILPLNDAYPIEVGHMAGLLAYRPDTDLQPYAAWYSPDRWHRLAELFVTDHNRLLGLPPVPPLHTALSLGLSALKTLTCHGSVPMIGSALPSPMAAALQPRGHHGQNGAARTNNGLGLDESEQQQHHQHQHQQLKYVPQTAMILTTNVCPICSTELNELARFVPQAHQDRSHLEPDLMMLPNGRAYGKERLEKYASKAGVPSDKVRDLVTGELFLWDSLKRVFIT